MVNRMTYIVIDSKNVVKTLILLFLCFIVVKTTDAQSSSVAVKDLRTEYLHDPDGIDMAHPRFSWIIGSAQRGVSQRGYEILVATELSDLSPGKADMWDSQQVTSDKSVNVVYNGKKLESDKTYYWTIRVKDPNNQWSDWSRAAIFHTGLLNKSDWQGEWIGAPDTTISSPLLRKEFNLGKKVKSAHVFISGLGYYELYLDGEKVGNHKLDPGTSDFNKRALYVAYDVTNYLNKGDNAIGVWLGNGYFRMNRKRPFRYYGDRPQLMLQMNITYTDGSTVHVVSNTSWKVSASPIVANSVYDGEIYDARREKKGWDTPGYNDQSWSNAVDLKAPKTRKLSAQLMPPIRVEKRMYPIKMNQPVKNTYVFDFGQNFTGWPVLRVNGGEGERVVMKTAEVSRKDMVQMQGGNTTSIVDTIDNREDRSAKARDIYILSGKPGTEVYSPRFTYQGFRYVQVQGYPGKPNLTSVTADFVHTDVTKVGSFKCSNPLFNRIHHNVLWGQRSDLMSMPTDCPQRDERMGWMADADLSAEEAMHNFDMAAFYTNWINEIQDEQNTNGSVPDIVPDHKWLSGTHIGTPSWQVAYPLLVWYMHKYYGDNRIIEEHYNSLKKWMDYMKSISHDYIITRGRGDWVPPERGGTPGDHSIALTSTGYYYISANLMAHMAGILGRKSDSLKYAELAQHIKEAFNNRFWNKSKGDYNTGSQTSDVFPLYAGLVPKIHQQQVLNQIIENINLKHNGHLWVGILGVKALIEALPEYDKTNVLYKITDQRTYPGWGYMIAKGSTTLWERWGGYRYFNAGMNSLNHIMFGSIDEFFYKDIAGIRSLAPGFKKILIKPYVSKKMTYAEGSVKTIHGRVTSDWKKAGNSFILKVVIPANCNAVIDVPKTDLKPPYRLTESNKVIWENQNEMGKDDGVTNVTDAGKYLEVAAGSGTYKFILSGHSSD